MTQQRLMIAAKVLLAAGLIAILAGGALLKILPGVGFATLAFSILGAMVCLFVVIVLFASLSLTFNQFILRHGGTDTSWLWFRGDPKGLQQLREQAAAEKASGVNR